MRLSNETINTARESIKWSILKIRNFDYSYGHYDPDKYQFYEKCRKDSLSPLLTARDELREFINERKSNE